MKCLKALVRLVATYKKSYTRALETQESFGEYLESEHFALVNYTKNTNNKSLKDLWMKKNC